MIEFLIVIIVVLLLVIFISVKKNIELNDVIDETSDNIDASLVIIEECYVDLSKKLEIELLSDEPVVRELVDDMKKCKQSLLVIANVITKNFTDEDEE